MFVYGYRNETHNGASRVVGTLEQAQAQIVALTAQYTGTKFVIVKFKKVEAVEAHWATGKGRAGNDYRMARNVTRYVECK